MLALADLLADAGDLDQARRLYRGAAASGHPEVEVDAEERLADLD